MRRVVAFWMTSWMRGGASTGWGDQPSAASTASSPARAASFSAGHDPADDLTTLALVADLEIEGETDGRVDHVFFGFPTGAERA